MNSDFKSILLSREKIDAAVKQMGERITQDYNGEEIVLVCILRGAFIFCADLARSIDLPVEVDFISASSYGRATESSGNVQINKDLEMDIEGKNVMLVEDIIDSGLTLKTLRDMMLLRNPKSIRIVTLLDKTERRKADIHPDYCCFDIPDEFVVGYGLDYDSRYRNVPDVMVLDEKVYS